MTLRELLIEWQSYQSDLCEVYPDGSVKLVYDGYWAEFEADEIDGSCGYSRAQAMVFAGVCSAIEQAVWNSGWGDERKQLLYSFRAKETEREPVYTALIVWLNPYPDFQTAYQASGTERGSVMLEAWLKFLQHVALLRRKNGVR